MIMKRFPAFLPAAVLAALLGGGCGIPLYTLDAVKPPEAYLTEDQEGVTLARGDLSVTVGPLGHVHGNEMRIGVLVRNNADKALPVRLQDARVLLDGQPVALMDQAEIDRLKRMGRMTAAMSAASTSLAQSNVSMTRDPREGSLGERRGDPEKAALAQGMERSLAAQQLSAAALNATQARNRLGEQYAAELANANSVSWSDTYLLRSSIPQNVGLMDQHLWRDETIPPRSWVLRCLITDPGSVERLLGGKEGRLRVEIQVGGERFAYGFDAVVRSLGEANAEIKTRRARALAARRE